MVLFGALLRIYIQRVIQTYTRGCHQVHNITQRCHLCRSFLTSNMTYQYAITYPSSHKTHANSNTMYESCFSAFLGSFQLQEETMCDHLGVSECSSKNKRAWHHSGLLVHEEESELWMPEELLIKLPVVG